MPIPFIVGAVALIAGAAGMGSGIRGGIKMKDANDTMKIAQERHNKNIDRFKNQNKKTTADMDNVGNLELNILSNFKEFQDVFEKIKNRPEFKEYKREGVNLPKYDGEKLKKVSAEAAMLMAAISGAAAGTAGGFAAAGTGTVATTISLSTMALGGGAVAAGGGGAALGTAAWRRHVGNRTFGRRNDFQFHRLKALGQSR